MAQHFAEHPPQSPYQNTFGELGSRLQLLRQWAELIEAPEVSTEDRKTVSEAIETTVAANFPFLVNAENNTAPLANLQRSFSRDQGIVITTGAKTFRHACHLLATLRQTLHSTLPVEIVHAGDADLPAELRAKLAELARGLEGDYEVEFVDILDRFNDSSLELATGGWAIKAFAALSSKFSQPIIIDADAVFVQPVEVLYNQQGYKDTGVLLFHDRLLWQGAFPKRHGWWHSQILHPSPTLEKSLVWKEMYAEEADSGVVVLDKSRLDVLLGLLHIAWQNTKPVRDEVTYTLTYGDKESWWLGMELARARYSFEAHYAAVVGWPEDENSTNTADSDDKICSFVIGHLDDNDALLWYNGGLPKNKMTQPEVFEVPTHWMVDGQWHKGATKQDMSCMDGRAAVALTDGETGVLRGSMDVAKEVDSIWRLV